jgi:SAM-dependent MidA family methyltransferase
MLPEGEQMNPIRALVEERGGMMRFRDFMELALYHPEFGYYGSGRAELGRKGDYFTSVSVGAVFGELLGWQFREMWERLGRPAVFTIVEQGANDGTFAGDALRWSRAEAPEFFEALRYEIVEGLEVLRGRQGERLAEFGGKVRWWKGLEELPRFAGVHFSNELIDAFPVHVVRFREGEWRELCVTGELEWRERALENFDFRYSIFDLKSAAPRVSENLTDSKRVPEFKDPNAELLERLTDAPRVEGYTTEVSLDATKWAKTVAGKIERGWVLVIDYGFPRERYYAPERRAGTLECYAGHAKGFDPLARPGFCDLTAHVEFTSLAEAFQAAGMEIAGYTDQHHFLTGLVSRVFAERAPAAQEGRWLKTLLHPEMMGSAFKVLGMARGTEGGGLAGFQFARGELGELTRERKEGL